MRFLSQVCLVTILFLTLVLGAIFITGDTAWREKVEIISDHAGASKAVARDSGSRQKYIEGEILVRFKKALSEFSVREDGELNRVQEGLSISDISSLIEGKNVLEDLEHSYLVKFDSRYSVEKAVREFEEMGLVEYAEPNYLYYLAATPNDTWFASRQWALNGSSSYGIDAEDAWDTQTGSSGVIVAVIDTGIDYNHPDLNGNMWPTGKGGWNFVNNDDDPMDDHGHGTHCAGIVAAETNNATGVAGIAGGWGATPGTQLMALKAFNSGGTGSTSDIVSAINYAVLNSANVISMSFVSTSSSSSIQTALNNAYSAELVLVAATGNDNIAPLPYNGYPAKYSNVIAVTATTTSGTRASYANYGTWVDIAAPGGSGSSTSRIYSTIWDNTYDWKNGTSMACPCVAGVAALLKAENPAWTSAQIYNRIVYTTKNIESLNSSYKGKFGSGLLNANDALESYNLFPHASAEGMGTSPDIDRKLWKVYNFTCDQGAAKVKVNAYAQKNGSSDDDDLKMYLDGSAISSGGWNGVNAWNGNALDGASKTVTVKQTLQQGYHTLEFYADETPTINSILVSGTDSTVTYLEEAYPNETTSPPLDVALWKDTEHSFTTASAGTVRITVTAKGNSNGASDDDDLKMVLVETGGSNTVADFGWNSGQSWNGNELGGCSKAVSVEQFLPAGNYKLQFWADETPHLQSVVISGAANDGNLFSIYPNADYKRGEVGLMKEYTFVATGNTNFQIIAACDSNGSSDDDDLRFEVDGQMPANGNWGEANAWDGDTLDGSFKTVTVNDWNLSAGSHTLSIYADETPLLASVKITGTNFALTETVKQYPNVSGNPGSGKQQIYSKDFTNINDQVRIHLLGQTENAGAPGGDEDLRIELDGTSYNWDMNGDYQDNRVQEIVLEKTLTPELHNLKVYVDEGGTLYSVFITEANQNDPILSYATSDVAHNLDRGLWKTFTFDSSGSITIELTGIADKNISDDDDLKIVVDGNNYNWNSSYALNGDNDQSRVRTFSLTNDFGGGNHTLQIYSDVTPTFWFLNIR